MKCEYAAKKIEDFIRDETRGFGGVVLGVSGGVDSAIVAYLSADALGSDKVLGVVMPYQWNENTDDAIELSSGLGIDYKIIEIGPVVDAIESMLGVQDPVAIQNIKARVRMTALYGLANEMNRLVAGTGNKSELMTGYLTKYGDGGVDMEPIGDLYKTEVWELAEYLGVPEKIVKKAPSADLYPGQTDEGDMGIDYRTLDRILQGDTSDAGVDATQLVKNLVQKSEHKRRMPRYPIMDW